MGRYRKKPYKKQQMDIYHHKAIEDEIEDELDLFYDQNQEGSVLFFDEEPMFLDDEPRIVKQLREEELQGKLPMWLADFNKEKNNDTVSKKQDTTEENNSNQSKMIK
ncbi:MAG: hypothetical protein KGY65_06725 [Candidatus Thermoplasmatota archaeon]|nr:hypothetical protein [Candidatus Thermoplasmatota archaeon]MBS3802427.1 hypothetical protein [Candidatus Thermoplasmatota archaeon]